MPIQCAVDVNASAVESIFQLYCIPQMCLRLEQTAFSFKFRQFLYLWKDYQNDMIDWVCWIHEHTKDKNCKQRKIRHSPFYTLRAFDFPRISLIQILLFTMILQLGLMYYLLPVMIDNHNVVFLGNKKHLFFTFSYF